MGFLGFFNFAFSCFHLLALPLLGLGYPLSASIRAIETNSIYHMRKLVTYWIIFSLISLFELAFVKLIEWIPLWPYIKLGIICWLVLPRFNGAHYCYKSFIQPCFSVNIDEIMERFYKRQKASGEKDNFLSVAERYVTENGTEALEKLIASKQPNLLHQKGPGTGFVVEETKAVAEADKKGIPQMVTVLFKGSRTDFGVEKIKTVAETEKNEMPQMVKAKLMDPVLQTKKKSIAAVEVKEMTTPPAATGETLPAKNPSEKVQKEWTCAVCQVTTTCDSNLNSHLRGKKHRAKCEELKLKTTFKAGPSNSASKREPSSRDGLISQDKIKKLNERVQVKFKDASMPLETLKRWCPHCDITCTSETDFLSHLNGKKHLARVQEMAVYPAGVQG